MRGESLHLHIMIHFTKHALDKFEILERHGVNISKEKILQTVLSPDLIDRSRYPLNIAQSEIDANHVLRVVYKIEQGLKIIITFYPAIKKQYEK